MADSHGGHISRAYLPPSLSLSFLYLFNTHSFILPSSTLDYKRLIESVENFYDEVVAFASA